MNRDVIAIGASLGGPSALKQLLAGMPPDLPAMIFVTMHIGADSRNLFADIFAAHAGIAVTTARDAEEPQRGKTYVAPADHHLLIIDGLIRLGRGPRENMSRPAIDPLFRSVGMTYGPRSIAVVLTGMLNDGAAGIADVKRCGGVTVVQNPADALALGMPLAALNSTDVDYRAPLAEIPELIVTLTSQEAGMPRDIPDSIAAEVSIALGRQSDSDLVMKFADPSTLSCPSCHGVLSQMRTRPLRFRCQVGHAFSGEILEHETRGKVEEAIVVALRIVNERAVLCDKLAQEAVRDGAVHAAKVYRERSAEVRGYADVLRETISTNGQGSKDDA
jgi:two-component system, chemotaxis family, protein-glutamate methylesterase/glutaminase